METVIEPEEEEQAVAVEMETCSGVKPGVQRRWQISRQEASRSLWLTESLLEELVVRLMQRVVLRHA